MHGTAGFTATMRSQAALEEMRMFSTRDCQNQGLLREPWRGSSKSTWGTNDNCPAYVTLTPGLAAASSKGATLPGLLQADSNKAEELRLPSAWLSSKTKSGFAGAASGSQRHSAPPGCIPDFSPSFPHESNLLGTFSQGSLTPKVKNTFLDFSEDCSDDDDDSDEMPMVHAKTMPVWTASNEECLEEGLEECLPGSDSGGQTMDTMARGQTMDHVQDGSTDLGGGQTMDHVQGGPTDLGLFNQGSLTPKVKNTFLDFSEDCSDDDDDDEMPMVHAKTMPVWNASDMGLEGSEVGEQSTQCGERGPTDSPPDWSQLARLAGPNCSSLSTTAPFAKQARPPLPAYVRVSPTTHEPQKNTLKEAAACMPLGAKRANASSSGGVREVANNVPVHQGLLLERCDEQQESLDNFSEADSNPIHLSDSSQFMTMFKVKNTFLNFSEDSDGDEDEMPMVHTMSCPPERAMHQTQMSGWVKNSCPPGPTKLSMLEQRRQTCPAYVRATPTLLTPPVSEQMQQNRLKPPPNLPAPASEPWTAPMTVDHHPTAGACTAAASPAAVSAPAWTFEVPQPEVSKGAALHSTGGCMPCPWFWKPQGCLNGEECLRCHLCPEGELKARRRAKTAELRQKQRVKAEAAPDQL